MDWRQAYFALALDLGYVTSSLFAVWSQTGTCESTLLEKVDYVLRKFHASGIRIAKRKDMNNHLVYQVYVDNSHGWLFINYPNQLLFSIDYWCVAFKIKDDRLSDHRRTAQVLLKTPWAHERLDAFVDQIKTVLR